MSAARLRARPRATTRGRWPAGLAGLWVLAALAGLAGLAGWALWLAARRVRLRRQTLGLPHWPVELAGLRVAVVSDLHIGGPHVDATELARLVAQTNRARPDLVVLLGDYVDPTVPFGTPVAPDAVAAELGRLRAPLGVPRRARTGVDPVGGRHIPSRFGDRFAGGHVEEDGRQPVRVRRRRHEPVSDPAPRAARDRAAAAVARTSVGNTLRMRVASPDRRAKTSEVY